MFLEKLFERVVIQESCYNPDIQGLPSDSGAVKLTIPACPGIAKGFETQNRKGRWANREKGKIGRWLKLNDENITLKDNAIRFGLQLLMCAPRAGHPRPVLSWFFSHAEHDQKKGDRGLEAVYSTGTYMCVVTIWRLTTSVWSLCSIGRAQHQGLRPFISCWSSFSKLPSSFLNCHCHLLQPFLYRKLFSYVIQLGYRLFHVNHEDKNELVQLQLQLVVSPRCNCHSRYFVEWIIICSSN